MSALRLPIENRAVHSSDQWLQDPPKIEFYVVLVQLIKFSESRIKGTTFTASAKMLTNANNPLIIPNPSPHTYANMCLFATI